RSQRRDFLRRMPEIESGCGTVALRLAGRCASGERPPRSHSWGRELRLALKVASERPSKEFNGDILWPPADGDHRQQALSIRANANYRDVARALIGHQQQTRLVAGTEHK